MTTGPRFRKISRSLDRGHLNFVKMKCATIGVILWLMAIPLNATSQRRNLSSSRGFLERIVEENHEVNAVDLKSSGPSVAESMNVLPSVLKRGRQSELLKTVTDKLVGFVLDGCASDNALTRSTMEGYLQDIFVHECLWERASAGAIKFLSTHEKHGLKQVLWALPTAVWSKVYGSQPEKLYDITSKTLLPLCTTRAFEGFGMIYVAHLGEIFPILSKSVSEKKIARLVEKFRKAECKFPFGRILFLSMLTECFPTHSPKILGTLARIVKSRVAKDSLSLNTLQTILKSMEPHLEDDDLDLCKALQDQVGQINPKSLVLKDSNFMELVEKSLAAIHDDGYVPYYTGTNIMNHFAAIIFLKHGEVPSYLSRIFEEELYIERKVAYGVCREFSYSAYCMNHPNVSGWLPVLFGFLSHDDVLTLAEEVMSKFVESPKETHVLKAIHFMLNLIAKFNDGQEFVKHYLEELMVTFMSKDGQLINDEDTHFMLFLCDMLDYLSDAEYEKLLMRLDSKSAYSLGKVEQDSSSEVDKGPILVNYFLTTLLLRRMPSEEFLEKYPSIASFSIDELEEYECPFRY